MESKTDTLVYKVIECALQVYDVLGYRFSRLVYQRSLEIEMVKKNLQFTMGEIIPINYGKHQVGTLNINFIVESQLLVAIHSLGNLGEPILKNLDKTYVSNIDKGLLIHFSGMLFWTEITQNTLQPTI
ncbi:MAG: GxxExxY protein [Bacteroidota bacterium]